VVIDTEGTPLFFYLIGHYIVATCLNDGGAELANQWLPACADIQPERHARFHGVAAVVAEDSGKIFDEREFK
jgi:hypothetical protein